MGTTLTGTTPQDTYDSLIKVTDNGPLSGTAKYLSDGLGNDSVLALSTTAAGIGTSSPAALLSLSKSADASINVNTAATGTFPIKSGISFGAATTALGSDSKYTGGAGIQGLNIQQADNVTDLIFWTTAGGSPSEKVRITSAGNVGIGTSAPAGPLEVVLPARTNEDTSAQHAIFGSGTSGNGIRIGYNSANNIGFISALKPASAWSDLELEGGSIRFAPTGTERVRVTSDGLTFNGDTAAANALDDYEEGTFNFGIAFGGSSTGVTYGQRVGVYTKIGRQVTITGQIALSSKGAEVGDATITGLPFTIGNGSQFQGGVCFGLSLNITFADMLFARLASNSTTCAFYESTNAGVLTALTNADFANNSQIDISLTYFV